jgi:hypothetical protein
MALPSAGGADRQRTIRRAVNRAETISHGQMIISRRTFLDGITIEMGKSFREQMILLDLGSGWWRLRRTRHHAAGMDAVKNSASVKLMALVFTRNVTRQKTENCARRWSSVSTGSR